eukprot:RCo027637
MHLPLIVHPMALVYNLPNVTTRLVLSKEALVQIWTGEISTWSDAALVSLNPSLSLPNIPIILVMKQGHSEETTLLTATLSQLSGTWQSSFGTFSDSDMWQARPATAARVVVSASSETHSIGAKVSATPYSVGFVPLFAALDSKLPVAMMRNMFHKATTPIPGPVQDAIENATLPADLSLSVVDLPGLLA